MGRLAIFLVLAGSVAFVGAATQPAEACKLLDKLLHRCHVCNHCGGHQCGYDHCAQPKCHCDQHGHYGLFGHGLFGHRRSRHQGYGQPVYQPYYSEPAYVEPVVPEYEQIGPGGRSY